MKQNKRTLQSVNGKPAPVSKTKKLKVQSKHFSRAYHTQVVFPEIKLSGKWLQDLGFTCGQEVTVMQETNKITISLHPQ